MANKHSSNTSYRIKTYSKTADSIETVGEIQLVDAEENPFISYDELLRCFTEILTKTTPNSETAAIDNLIANENDITAIFK